MSSKKRLNVKVIGLGGLGSWLVAPLCHFLTYAYPGSHVTFIDGDAYEDKNRDRQVFSKFGNKAEITLERMRELYPKILFGARATYVHDENVVTLIRDGDIVMLGVDNHATRRLISDRCVELDNIVLISGGNEYTNGTVQLHIRRDGEDATLPIANEFHPEIEFPEDRNPHEQGCEELVDAEPQLIITNNLVAARMLSVLYAFLEDKAKYDLIYTDVESGNSRAVAYERTA